MYTLILTLYSNDGSCVHSIPGFETHDLACQAGDKWQHLRPAHRSYVVVKMKLQ